MLEAYAVLLCVVVVDGCHLAILLERLIASRLVDKLVNDIFVFTSSAGLRNDVKLPHLLESNSRVTLLALSQSGDQIVDVSLLSQSNGCVDESALGPESSVRDIDVQGEAAESSNTSMNNTKTLIGALNGLNATTERGALLCAGEDGLLDGCVLESRVFTEGMGEEGNGLEACVVKVHISTARHVVEESRKTDWVRLADDDAVLVSLAARAWGLALLLLGIVSKCFTRVIHKKTCLVQIDYEANLAVQ